MKFYSETESVNIATIPTPGFRRTDLFIAYVAQPIRILLADDELEIWWEEGVAELVRSGHQVDTVEDGEAAWEALQTTDYDLLITDNKMPKLWGLDLIIDLRSQDKTMPIILVSSLLPEITPGQKPYFVNVHLLEKPVTPSQLLAAIDRVAPLRPRSRQPSLCGHG